MVDQTSKVSAIHTLSATISSPQVIADELNLPLAVVEATLAESAGYGTAPYGLGAYGRCKAVAERDAEVVRGVFDLADDFPDWNDELLC